MRCQCLKRGCIHDVLLRFGRRMTVLVIISSCSAHFLKRRPLLLHFPTPSVPNIPSQFWWSVPTLILKSSKRISLSVRGGRGGGGGLGQGRRGCRNHPIQIIIELVFNLISVGHCGCIGTYNCCMPLAR